MRYGAPDAVRHRHATLLPGSMAVDAVLSGDRIVMDQRRREALFAEVASDPEVTRYLTWTPHPDVDDAPGDHRTVQRRRRPDVADRAAGDGRNRRPVRLAESHTLVELGYCLARRWWGHGLCPRRWGCCWNTCSGIRVCIGCRRRAMLTTRGRRGCWNAAVRVSRDGWRAMSSAEHQRRTAGRSPVRKGGAMMTSSTSRSRCSVIVAPMAGGRRRPNGGRDERRRARFRCGRLPDRRGVRRAHRGGAADVVATAASISLCRSPARGHPRRSSATRRPLPMRRSATAPPRRTRYDDRWAAKLDVVLDMRLEAVSFTFGLPTTEVRAASCRRHHHRRYRHDTGGGRDGGRLRRRCGGGAGTFGGRASRHVRSRCAARGRSVGTPAGRIGDHRCPGRRGGRARERADDVGALRAGAVAAQLGTAFLLADEAGSSPVHRAALQDPQFTETVVTKAFSGRYARGLRNRFIDEHEAQAPLGYPERPARCARRRCAPAIRMPSTCGQAPDFGQRTAPVADIMKDLT